MLSNISLYVLLLICFSNCNNSATVNNIHDNPIFPLSVDSIKFVSFQSKDTIFKIINKQQIESIMSNINRSKIEYLKFGSSKSLTFYDIGNQERLKVFFRNNYIKIAGVVYKSPKELFVETK